MYVHFRDNERGIRVHPKRARIIDDEAPLLHGGWYEFAADRCARRGEYQIYVIE
jgi:hypothetical protein